MSNKLRLVHSLRSLPADQVAPIALPGWKTDAMDARIGEFRWVLQLLLEGASVPVALEQFCERTGKSVETGRRWLKAYQSGGLQTLAPKYKGRQRKQQEWDVRAKALNQLPSRPNCGEIASRLRVEGFGPVQPHQVRRYLQTIPSDQAETSPKRLGQHYHRLNETPYVIREWGHVPVGYLYELDGHTCDFYIEHPITGGYFRPELTIITDVRSRYIVDFWIGGFENSTDIRWMLSRAFMQHDHVCHELHVDPGAAKAKAVSDLVSGYCTKMDVDIHFALPGNARGKGLIEGEYKIFEGCFGKFIPTYLHNRTDDAMRLFADKWKKRLFPRITVQQLCDLILTDYVTPRRTEPRKGLDGASPAELWATLERNPVLVPATAICRPRREGTVQHRRVRIHNRRYQAVELAQFEDRRVLIEYDDWHDSTVWIYDLNGNFICTAKLVSKRPGIPESRVAERIAATAKGQHKRLQIKAAEISGRANIPISPAHVLDSLDCLDPIERPNSQSMTLAVGHSFVTPTLPAQRPLREITRSAVDRVAAHMQEEAEEQETADDRYTRACALERADDLDGADAQWLLIYQSSSEYSSRRLLAEEFQDDAGALTPASDTTARLDDGFTTGE